MKYLILSISVLFFLVAKGQTITTSFNGLRVDTIRVREQNLIGELTILLSVDTTSGTYTLQYNREEATASRNMDYELPIIFDSIVNRNNGSQNIFIIRILPDSSVEGTEFINLRYSINGRNNHKLLTIIIEDDDFVPTVIKKENTLLETEVTYLNAFAFDFGNTKKDVEYVAHANLFAQHKSKKSRWAYNVGFMKLNYRNNDTINSQTVSTEWISRKLYDTLKENDKYRVEQNAYYQKINNRDYSIYINPMFLINNGNEVNKNNKFFIHGYAELLVSQWEIENGYKTLRIDSIEYKCSIHGGPPGRSAGPVLYDKLKDKNSYTYKEITGNFGIGITYYSMPIKGVKFFFQSTVGFNTNGVFYKSFDSKYNLVKGKDERDIKYQNKIYLIRTMINMAINEKTDLRLGADVRGYFNVSVPKYALYLGLNIKFDELLKLIK